MNLLSLLIFSAVLCLIVVFVKSFDARVGAALTAAASVWLLVIAGRELLTISSEISEAASGISEYLPYIYKSLCIGFVAQTSAEICSDAGEKAVASKVTMLGKLGILTVCLPLIKSIIQTAVGYI